MRKLVFNLLVPPGGWTFDILISSKGAIKFQYVYRFAGVAENKPTIISKSISFS